MYSQPFNNWMEKGLHSDLINTNPAVRTIPPIAQETLSLNGISLVHCWKSSKITEFSPFLVDSNCEAFHESATEPRLALSPQQKVSSEATWTISDDFTRKPAARQRSVPLETHSAALPHTKSFTPQGARTWCFKTIKIWM